ncbi:class E sortase [Candidatus Saccharibacteria bacterium]|nr:class E sortase [Candidatus Saccharibacteria bacterium]
MSDQNWRRANVALFAIIVCINAYIIAAPFLPNAIFWFRDKSGATEKSLQARLDNPTAVPDTPPTPGVFHADSSNDGLIIPKMQLETPLVEGPKSDSFNLLNKGAWRLPFASSPDKGGNTVIAGHRFSYTGPRGIFYFLNKLEYGDEIGLWYQGQFYRYAIESTGTHAATDTYVQEQTTDERLTLYTCTPLWNPTSRLVVVAKPITPATGKEQP